MYGIISQRGVACMCVCIILSVDQLRCKSEGIEAHMCIILSTIQAGKGIVSVVFLT